MEVITTTWPNWPPVDIPSAKSTTEAAITLTRVTLTRINHFGVI